MNKTEFLHNIVNSSCKSKFDKTSLTEQDVFNITYLVSGEILEYYSCKVLKDNKSETWLTAQKKRI